MGKQGSRSYAGRRAERSGEPEEGAIEIVGEGFLYDYDEVDAEVKQKLQDIVVDIRQRQKRLMEDILATGNQLRLARVLIGHGKFQVWAQTETYLSLGSINEFIHIAERFGDKPSIIEALTPTTARLLAGPTTPDEVIIEVVELYEKEGRPPLVREVKAIKERAKQIAIADAMLGVIDPADVVYELDAGYYAVVLEGGVWTRLRNATRHKSLSEVLSRDDIDQLALAIAAGLSEEVEPLGREAPVMDVLPPELTFEKWLDLMPPSNDVADLNSLLQVVRSKLWVARQFDGLELPALNVLTHLEHLIEEISKRVS